MEHTFCCCNGDFSADFDVDGEINFSGQSGALNIDNTNSFDSFDGSAIFNHIDEIFGFSWLTDQNYCLMLSDVSMDQLCGIEECYFFECVQFFEEKLWSQCCIIRWPACNEC